MVIPQDLVHKCKVRVWRGRGVPRGGYSWESSVGMCRPVLQILTSSDPKKCNFPHPFSDLAFRQNLCYHYLDQSANKKIFKPFRIRIFLFLSYSFGIEAINTSIRYRSSLEHHTRYQTKMGKVYTRFQTKTAQKPCPKGQHKYKGVPPGGPPFSSNAKY